MEITISSRGEKESSLQPVHCDSIEDMTAAFKSGAKYIEIPDDVWQKYINDCEGTGHLDDPGLPGVNGVDGIDDCEGKYEKEKLNHMCERAKSEGWYKGTLDDFRKFEDRSHWIPYGKFNKDINIHLDESQLQRKKGSYELALKLFYHGTLEDFLLFTANYCWGPVRKDSYID